MANLFAWLTPFAPHLLKLFLNKLMSKINNLREHMVRLNSVLKEKTAGENIVLSKSLI